MKEQIERSTGQQVDRVSVKLRTEPAKAPDGADGMNPQAAEPVISSVEVVMAQVKPEEEGADPGAAGRGPEVSIAPVEKIKISVNARDSAKVGDTEGQTEAQSSAAMAGSGDEAQDGAALKADAKPPADRLVSQIEKLLQQNWGVDQEAVTVLGAANPNEDNAGR